MHFTKHLNILLLYCNLDLSVITIQECRKLLLNPDYLAQNIVPLYQQEEDKYHFAKLKLLHQFFQNGVQQHEITYLETLCFLLDEVFSTVFSSPHYQKKKQPLPTCCITPYSPTWKTCCLISAFTK
ncbi:MAG: hypothetical protein COW65_19085 [Cytophagales bacterium CG18_big_fil_WC_8_21_14_2_50_42_9]|nr:MAG: hypothetical protein COW65_19085 [Cytophagales bacterium CG18_big_fil_WC_8_21_14_2_50_42_9]